jgi:hypothetical protein
LAFPFGEIAISVSEFAVYFGEVAIFTCDAVYLKLLFFDMDCLYYVNVLDV